MNWILCSFLLIALFIIGWLTWRYLTLRHHLNDLTQLIRRTAEGEAPIHILPEDEKYLEEYSNAVKALAVALQSKVEAVDAERAKLATAIDQMTDGVLIADASGLVQLINPAAERLFGVHSEDVLRRSITEVLRHYQLVDTWRRSIKSGELQDESIEIPAKRQYLHLISIPDQYTHNASLVLVQDLTHLRRLETVRQDFISNLSHELRTPLASLKALTETLQAGALDDPPAARRFLERIQTEVDAITQMAQELLDLSRIESGRVSLTLRKETPMGLLQSAAERMRLQVERANLSLQIDCPPDLPNVLADRSRIEQLLVNLIHNAVKFTRPGGEVTLSAKAEEKVVCFAVRDTGVGIPEDDLPRIFERFFKTDRARSGGGTGLGLSIVSHLVEAHGGKIWAESTEGRGSTFYFTIPIIR